MTTTIVPTPSPLGAGAVQIIAGPIAALGADGFAIVEDYVPAWPLPPFSPWVELAPADLIRPTNPLAAVVIGPGAPAGAERLRVVGEVRADGVRIDEQTSPATVADTGALSAQDVLGIAELFYRDDAGNDVQITSGGAVAGGGGGADINIADNAANAFNVHEGANGYVQVDTLNAAEAVRFGNAVTNPAFAFLGAGAVTVTGALQPDGGVDRSVAGTLAIGGANSTEVALGTGAGTVRALVVDNTAAAWRVRQGADNYLVANTTNGGESVTVGNAGLGTTVTLAASGASSMALSNGGTVVAIPDNTATAFRIHEGGGNTYFNIVTTNAAEVVQLGTTATNPLVHVRGTGGLQVDGPISATGGGVGTDIQVPDNINPAFRMRQATNFYLDLSTINGSELFTIGNNTQGNIRVRVPNAAGLTRFTVAGTAQNYIRVDTGTGNTVTIGAGINAIDLSAGANIGNALRLTAGAAGTLMQISSVTGSEFCRLGNTTVDPDIELVGTGDITIGDTGASVGFLGAAAAPRTAAYTVTNPVTTRTFDTVVVTTQTLAQVVGTLIADLQTFGLFG